MRPFIKIHRAVTITDEDRYQREIQDRLAPVIPENTWRVLRIMVLQHHHETSKHEYAISHVKQPYRDLLQEASDQGMIGAFAVNTAIQRLMQQVSHDPILEDFLGSATYAPKPSMLLGRPLKLTTLMLHHASVLLYSWAYHERTLSHMCDTLYHIQCTHREQFESVLHKRAVIGSLQMMLNLLMIDAFAATLEEVPMHHNSPWAWQSPILMHHFLQNMSAMTATDLAPLVTDLIHHPPKR